MAYAASETDSSDSYPDTAVCTELACSVGTQQQSCLHCDTTSTGFSTVILDNNLLSARLLPEFAVGPSKIDY